MPVTRYLVIYSSSIDGPFMNECMTDEHMFDSYRHPMAIAREELRMLGAPEKEGETYEVTVHDVSHLSWDKESYDLIADENYENEAGYCTTEMYEKYLQSFED